jgi:hypothetical protein
VRIGEMMLVSGVGVCDDDDDYDEGDDCWDGEMVKW